MSLEKRVAMLEKTVHEEHMRFQRMLMMLGQIDERDENSSQPSTQSNPGG
jgi:hypothetical protein